jgi:hypothetical protein
MNSRSLLIFLGLNRSENEFLIHAQCRARFGSGLQSTGRGGLPRAAGRQAGSSHVRQRGGTLTGGKVVAGSSRGQREGTGQGGQWAELTRMAVQCGGGEVS